MQGLLTEFRGLYENRLRKLDEAERAGENIDKVRTQPISNLLFDSVIMFKRNSRVIS